MNHRTNMRLLSALLAEIRNRKHPRKIWLILKGGTLPLVLDTWTVETYDKDFIGIRVRAEGETPIFTKGYVVADYMPNGEIRMMVDIDEIVAIKFYEQ